MYCLLIIFSKIKQSTKQTINEVDNINELDTHLNKKLAKLFKIFNWINITNQYYEQKKEK